MILEISFLKKAIPYGFLFHKTLQPLKSLHALPSNNDVSCTVSIDTRTLEQGQLFFALEGDEVDGHDFLSEAIEKGAIGLCINESRQERLKAFSTEVLESLTVFVVPDTQQALFDLARMWRQHFVCHVVAVTGSVGKTTTKEMLRSIFQVAGIPACVSLKNQNTLVGLALNILRMSEGHKVAVFEVGVSEKGEMVEKAELLRPTIGVITTVAHSHMKGLGKIAEIAQEKRAIFSFFGPGNIGVVFGDNRLLDDASYAHPIVRFGLKTKNHVQARKIRLIKNDDGRVSSTFLLKLYKEKMSITLRTNHKGAIANVLAASAVAYLLEIPLPMIVRGIRNFVPVEGRFEMRSLKNNHGLLINDCYNASPESMRSALLAIEEMEVSGAKIAVLGDMFELGEQEDFWHRQIGRVLCRTLSVKQVILVGERAKQIAKTAPLTTKCLYATDWRDAVTVLQKTLSEPDSLVLVKASNGMELKNLVVTMT